MHKFIQKLDKVFQGIKAISNVNAVKLINSIKKKNIGYVNTGRYMKPLGFYREKRLKKYTGEQTGSYARHWVIWWVRG